MNIGFSLRVTSLGMAVLAAALAGAQSVSMERTTIRPAVKATWGEIVVRAQLNTFRKPPRVIKNKFDLPPAPLSTNPQMMFAPSVEHRRGLSSLGSPAPSLTFPGVRDDNTVVPPDTNGAVGPRHVVTALNNLVRIHDRSGATLSTVRLESFFARLQSSFVFDPRTRFDPVWDRWIMIACLDGPVPTSRIGVAVSATDDPTGEWYFYELPTPRSRWLDYPSVGGDPDYLVVQANAFPLDGEDVPFRSAVYILDKREIYNAATPNLNVVQMQGFGGTHSPATHYESGNEIYLLNVAGADSTNSFFARLYKIVKTPEMGFEATQLFFELGRTYPSSREANFAEQKGTVDLIANNDFRLHNLVVRNGMIYGAQTQFVPLTDPENEAEPTRAAIRWFQYDPITPAIVQNGMIGGPNSPSFYAFPSVAVNKEGDVLIGYSRFNEFQFAGAVYALHDAEDAPGTLRAEFEFQRGLATYFKDFGAGTNRWGDYSSTEVDPNDDRTFWTIQQFADTPRNTWSTRWAMVVPPLPPQSVRIFLQQTNGQRVLGYWTTKNGQIQEWKRLAAVAPEWTVRGFGDADNDGILDILLFRGGDRRLGFWKTDGSNIVSWVSYPSAGPSSTLALGLIDVDDDAKTDVLWYRPSDRMISWWKMDGRNRLAWNVLRQAPAGFTPVNLFHDLNGDGRKDIVMQDATGQVAGWWLQPGGAVGGWRLISEKIDADWKLVGFGDVNSDGKDDMIVQNNTTNRLGAYTLEDNVVTGFTANLPNVATNWAVRGAGTF